jgi:hypothetical protein
MIAAPKPVGDRVVEIADGLAEHVGDGTVALAQARAQENASLGLSAHPTTLAGATLYRCPRARDIPVTRRMVCEAAGRDSRTLDHCLEHLREERGPIESVDATGIIDRHWTATDGGGA